MRLGVWGFGVSVCREGLGLPVLVTCLTVRDRALGAFSLYPAKHAVLGDVRAARGLKLHLTLHWELRRKKKELTNIMIRASVASAGSRQKKTDNYYFEH